MAAVLCGLSAPAFATEVTGLRMADRETSTRFVLDVPGLKEYKVFVVDKPDRLVIDIKQGSWHAPKQKLAQAHSALVKNIRYATHDGTKLRIVLDLTGPLKSYKAFAVPPNEDSRIPRLVVDFSANTEVRAPAEVVIRSEKTHEIPRSMQPVVKNESPPVVKPSGLTPKKKKETALVTKRARKPVIVIDPGHGGVDPGAMGRGKAREKAITFTYAVALKNELEKTGRYKVVLTRRGDYYVNLRKRVAVAQEAQGDIFISLHADSHPNPTTRGLSIYTISENASDKEAEALARRANREDVIEGVDLKGEPEDVKNVLIEMTQRDTKNLSARFAEILVKKVGKEARLLKNTHRFAGFVVLKGVDIPSVLVELGYLSNRHEERLLQTEAYKIKLVRAMKDALDVYFDTMPKE